jgi:hypothetical protein
VSESRERTVAGLDVEPQRHGYPVNYILETAEHHSAA